MLSPRKAFFGSLFYDSDANIARSVAQPAPIGLAIVATTSLVTFDAGVFTTAWMEDRVIAVKPIRKLHGARGTAERIVVGIEDPLERVAGRRCAHRDPRTDRSAMAAIVSPQASGSTRSTICTRRASQRLVQQPSHWPLPSQEGQSAERPTARPTAESNSY